MTETRRTLFKTSILSALGIMALKTAAKATDFTANRVIVRASKAGKDYDILVDASSVPTMAYILTAPHSGEPVGSIDVGGLDRASGIYSIAVPTVVNPAPTLTCNPLGVVFNNLAGNAWNEIGSRRRIDKTNNGKTHSH